MNATGGAPTLSTDHVRGDLLEQDVDCLVNPWNRNFVPRLLLLPQGVSGQLKKRTGPGPWKTLARAGTLPLGGAVVTDAGRMSNRLHLIHVAGLTRAWRASTRSVTLCVHSAVREAVRLHARTLAMPLIGSGTGSLSPDEARQAITAALEQYPPPLAGEPADLTVRVVTYP